MRPSTTPCQSPNADALNGRHGFPPRHPGSAGAGFGTGLCTAPFRPRPGICRCKARPSHTQRFLRLHPGSLAPMRQRPGLRFPIPHLESFPPHIRAVLACPLSVDRDGFLSLSLSLTEGNAPPFGPIRGRQRLEIPEALPPPKASFAGESVFLQGAAQTGGKGRAARFRGYFQGVPQTRGKTHAERWIRSRSVPPDRRQRFRTVNNNGIRRASPPEARQRFRTVSKEASGWAYPPTETRQRQQHLAAIFRGWLAYPDRRQRPDHAERGRAAYTSQIRGKGRHKRRASARHRHTPQTGGTGGARPHIKAGGRCRPIARPPLAGHPSWARNPPGRLRRPCAALPIP